MMLFFCLAVRVFFFLLIHFENTVVRQKRKALPLIQLIDTHLDRVAQTLQINLTLHPIP